MSMFKKHLPEMTFYQTIANLCDVQTLYKFVRPNEVQVSLGKACLDILGAEVDKSERMSNWEKRPLRLAQMHYGALDAYCMIPLVEKLIAKATETEGFDRNNFIKRETLLKKEEEAKGGKKKPNDKGKGPKKY